MLDDHTGQAASGAGEGRAARTGLGDGRSEEHADGQAQALRAVQTALLKEIDEAVSRLERARLGETTREHLEILRSLLKAQVTAYLEHFVSRRATLYSHTSVMYAGEVGPPGVLSATFRGLLDGGTVSGGLAARLVRLLGDRQTLVVFGDRATGKSTLLNSLFELVAMDERFVAVERGPDLPALKERSFCVRLGVNGDTDIPALFAKARRMSPGRLVVGEMHAAEMREFFRLLAEDPHVGGMATLRADSVGRAVEAIVGAFGEAGDEGRTVLASVKPVFAHMHSDEKGLPRLAALWAVNGLRDGELALQEVDTGIPAGSRLAAET
jgi:hypothetical protein